MLQGLRVAAAAVLALAAVSFANAEDPKEGDFPKWNTWKLACKGDWAEYAIGDGKTRAAGVKYEILDVTGAQIKYSRKSFDGEGNVTLTQELTRAWEKIRLMFYPPTAHKVEWRDDNVEIVGVKVKCRVASWVVKDADTGKDLVSEYWYSTELPCGGLVKAVTDGSTTTWITGFAFNGKTNRGEDGKPATATDPMPRFYAKVGNFAIYRITRESQALGFQKRTVTSSEPDLAKYQVVSCDIEGSPSAGATPIDREQARKEWHNRYAKPEEKDVKLKVDGGEYNCNVYKEGDMGGTTQTWISDGVIIKMVNIKDGKETVMELVKLTIKQ